jgi:hypothetical protein
LPLAMIALAGRAREALPNGSHVGVYKDALYADHEIAKQLTGAFRVIVSADACAMHVQLRPSCLAGDAMKDGLLNGMSEEFRPLRLVLWPYDSFPFGMAVDYERKFLYYVPGERES